MTKEEIADFNEWWQTWGMVRTSIRKRLPKKGLNWKIDEFFEGRLKVKNWKTKELLDPAKYRNLRKYLYLRVELPPELYDPKDFENFPWREKGRTSEAASHDALQC